METLDQEMKRWIGKTLDDRYEILSLVGYGGMAFVYRALDRRLNRDVAVKIMRDDAAADESVKSRFCAESHAVAMLSHPNIVAVYTVMDCSQFSVATEMSEKKGEAEIERQKLAQEEEDRRRKAEEDRKKKEEEYRAAHEAEIRYDEAMRNVYDFEKKQDYAQMAEWAGIALDHKSGDPEALKKKNDATRLLSEQKVREEQYRSIITRALENFKNGQWQDAKSQSEAALNLKPESAEAKKIYNQSTKKIEAAAEIEKYLTRADLFLAQKSYDEALRELKKVQSYDPENKEALNRINEIGNIRKEHDKTIARYAICGQLYV